MLTKDIELTRAIIDLVDNCIDGARRLRPKGNYKGLYTRIETTKEYFKIVDNCGGISIELACKYAFRFGRPPEMRPTPPFCRSIWCGHETRTFQAWETIQDRVYYLPIKIRCGA